MSATIIGTVEIYRWELTCLRCGHVWVHQGVAVPRHCVKCHSRAWASPPGSVKRGRPGAPKEEVVARLEMLTALIRDGLSMTEIAAKLGITRQRVDQIISPHKAAARAAVHAAVASGGLIVPDRCSACGTVGEVEAHHPDYSRPLDVLWLCPACHGAIHAATKRRGDAAYYSTLASKRWHPRGGTLKRGRPRKDEKK